MDSFFIGIGSGFVVSLVFLFFLFSLRPKIEISPFIARRGTGDDREYGFKFVNKGFFPIIDIKVMLRTRRTKNVAVGKIYRAQKIQGGTVWRIEGCRPSDKEHRYAQRFYKKFDLESK